MSKLLKYCTTVTSAVTMVCGILGKLAPVPEPDSKTSFVLFVCRTFSAELIFVGVGGLAILAAYYFGWIAKVRQSLQIIVGRDPIRSRASVNTQERWIAVSILGAVVVLGIASIGYMLYPGARATYVYVRGGHLMRDYRVELLVQARAAEVRGNIDEAIADLRQFAKLFPDRAETNDISYHRARLARQLEVANVLSKRADLLQRVGTTRAVLSLRIEALRLNPANKEFLDNAEAALNRVQKLTDSATSTLLSCGKVAPSERVFAETMVAMGFDQQPDQLVGKGSLADRQARFCAAVANWSPSDLAIYIDRLWAVENAKQALAQLTSEAREKRAQEYIASARPQVRLGGARDGAEDQESSGNHPDSLSTTEPAPTTTETRNFLDPARMGDDDDLSRSLYIFTRSDSSEEFCWYEKDSGFKGLAVEREGTGVSVSIDTWCSTAERRSKRGTEILHSEMLRSQYGKRVSDLIGLSQLPDNAKAENRDQILRALCQLSVTLNDDGLNPQEAKLCRT
jgi:tetratricopeptide (TPR) repeat protein